MIDLSRPHSPQEFLMVIKIQFSKPLMSVLEGAYPIVAKEMMQKGIKMIGDIVGENPESADGKNAVIH